MKYFMENENQPVKAKTSPILWFLPLIILAVSFMLDLLLGDSGAIEETATSSTTTESADPSGALFTLIGYVFICLLPAIKYNVMQKLSFTNKRIFGKYGLLRVVEMDSTLDKIQNVSVRKGIIGRIFGYGTIVISTNTREFKYRFIKEPSDFKEILINCIDNYQREL